jgi:hypothetical protein
MQAEVLLDTSERSKELRYVTLHFQSLQGLRSAPCWLSFLFLAGIAVSRVLSSRTMAWVGFGIATLNFGGYFAIGNWYSGIHDGLESSKKRRRLYLLDSSPL